MCLVCVIKAEEARLKQDEASKEAKASTQINTPFTDHEDTDSLRDDCSTTSSVSQPTAYHYFAIGSMTNTTALSLRELTPISSRPAMLCGYRLVFRGNGGMASAEKNDSIVLYDDVDQKDYPFNCIHGVLHLLTASDMQTLDEFEGGYEKEECKVLLYDNTTEISAYVYVMNKSSWPTEGPHPHLLPTERYVDIIAQGCAEHGVRPAWVDFIRQHSCIPRKKSTEFSSFSLTTAEVPIISWEAVRSNNGLNDAPLWIVINNIVLEFRGDTTKFFPYGYFIKHNIGGTDFTMRFGKGFYEPKYRLTKYMNTANELEIEHRAWIEDQFANPPPALASSKWAMVGVVTSEVNPNIVNCVRKTKFVSLSDGSQAGTPAAATPLASTTSTPTPMIPPQQLQHQQQKVLNLTEDVNAAVSQFFLSGNASGATVIIPNGLYLGQTVRIRKTSTTPFDGDVIIKIRNQSLGVPNIQADEVVMPPECYVMAWCWDGSRWFQE